MSINLPKCPTCNKILANYQSKTCRKHPSEQTRQKARENALRLNSRPPSWLGRKLTQEHKERLSRVKLGKKPSEETKKKISETLKGKPILEATKLKISASLKQAYLSGRRISASKGKTPSEETRQKMREARKRQIMTPEHKRKIGSANSGVKSNLWRGGVSKPNRLLRSSADYINWRKAVFQRDNWTCQFCEQRGGQLEADHIKPFAYFPELRLDITNGRTLCQSCHRKTPTYAKHPNNLKI